MGALTPSPNSLAPAMYLAGNMQIPPVQRVCLFVCTSLRAGLAQNLWVNFHELLVTVGTVTRNNRLHFDNDLDLGVLTFENARTTSPLKEAK